MLTLLVGNSSVNVIVPSILAEILPSAAPASTADAMLPDASLSPVVAETPATTTAAAAIVNDASVVVELQGRGSNVMHAIPLGVSHTAAAPAPPIVAPVSATPLIPFGQPTLPTLPFGFHASAPVVATAALPATMFPAMSTPGVGQAQPVLPTPTVAYSTQPAAPATPVVAHAIPALIPAPGPLAQTAGTTPPAVGNGGAAAAPVNNATAPQNTSLTAHPQVFGVEKVPNDIVE